MKIAFVSSEVVPYAKTGGLADVAGSLPIALQKLGGEVKLFMPKYGFIYDSNFDISYCYPIGQMPITVAGKIFEVHIFKTKLPGSSVEVYLIDSPYHFNRHSIYTNDKDEDERFILFSKAVIESMQRLKWAPDIIHCNDWQSALLPLLIKENYSWDVLFQKTASVLTIHNIGYQGRFPKETLVKAELDETHYYPGGPLEFHDSFSFLKTGILYSDVINTVSETYANEIMTEEYGAGMENILLSRKEDLYGILNGVDYDIWNPGTDKLIPYHFSVDDLSGKLENKKFLLQNLHLPFDEKIPLIGIVSRFVVQKGVDLLAKSFNKLIQLPVQWVFLGSGSSYYEDLFRSIAYAMPNKAAVYVGFNDELAHLIEAGSDMFLMPSLYEPCGLNQIYSLKYGTVPVVRKTGGLADTVQDWHEYLHKGEESGTGFSFYDYNSEALFSTVKRGVDTFAQTKEWKKIQLNGMNKDFSWDISAQKYFELYKKALFKRRGS